VKEKPFVPKGKDLGQRWHPSGGEGFQQGESTTEWLYGATENDDHARYTKFAVVANHDLITAGL
jgi:hypothetical protein